MAPALGTFNFSIAAIPAYYFINLLGHVYAQSLLIGVDKELKAYDNRNPRNNSQESIRKLMGPPKYELYLRGKAAHNNGNENFPLFVAAILAGNLAGLDQRALNITAAAILVQRVLYTIAYVMAKTRTQSYIRSLFWFSTTIMKLYVLIKAAMVMGPTKEFGIYW